jgi:fructose-1,6-bisphosphatase I/sedoheptulose-1,7-bisphosphatase/fructose-1,6-bisphosphatase I
MPDTRVTLSEFIVEEQRRSPGATPELTSLLSDLVAAFEAIGAAVGRGELAGVLGDAATSNVHGERQKKLDVVANELVLRACERGGHLAAALSEELDAPYRIPPGHPRGEYLLAIDPLDGSSNLDVNVSVGTIFSVLRRTRTGEVAAEEFLQPGTRQVCAGYAIYGPATMVVLTFGRGVHGFTLDRELGELVLTHPEMRIPEETREFAINASNERFWEPPVRRYVAECLAGRTGPREADFNMRWVASLVAEVHRILVRGGVFMYPRDTKEPARPGRLRLLYEASPMAMLVEAAGGVASTGRERLLGLEPKELHQRVPVILGSRSEVQRLERYHREHESDPPFRSPLFAVRSLFIE